MCVARDCVISSEKETAKRATMTGVSVSSFSFYKHYGTLSQKKKGSKDKKSSVNSLYHVPFDTASINHYISPFDRSALESLRGSSKKPNLPRPSLFDSNGVFGVRSEHVDNSKGVYAMFSKRPAKQTRSAPAQKRKSREKELLKEEKEMSTKLKSQLLRWRRGIGDTHLCTNIRRSRTFFRSGLNVFQ